MLTEGMERGRRRQHTFHQLGQVGGVLGLDSHAHDGGHGELHGLDGVGVLALLVGQGRVLGDELVQTHHGHGVTCAHTSKSFRYLSYTISMAPKAIQGVSQDILTREKTSVHSLNKELLELKFRAAFFFLENSLKKTATPNPSRRYVVR